MADKICFANFSLVAQLVERFAVNEHVPGSSPGQGANLDTGTAFVLWVSMPIEVRIERAGARKVYVKANKVKWALTESPIKIKTEV